MSRFQLQNTIPYHTIVTYYVKIQIFVLRAEWVVRAQVCYLTYKMTSPAGLLPYIMPFGNSFTVHNALWELLIFHHMSGHPGLPQSSHHVISCQQDITPNTWGSNLGSQGLSIISGPKVDG